MQASLLQGTTCNSNPVLQMLTWHVSICSNQPWQLCRLQHISNCGFVGSLHNKSHKILLKKWKCTAKAIHESHLRAACVHTGLQQ